MKEQTIQEYIDLHYGGDSSRVAFVKIDYSRVCSASQLISWAITTFGVPLDPENETPQTQPFLELLFRTLGERKQHYIVLESYPRHMTQEVKDILEGDRSWKQALGFHLSRDYLVQVAFFQDPETKGKQSRTKT